MRMFSKTPTTETLDGFKIALISPKIDAKKDLMNLVQLWMYYMYDIISLHTPHTITAHPSHHHYRYIGNLMLEVPFPSMMRPRVQMQIGNEMILFSLPVQTPLPLRWVWLLRSCDNHMTDFVTIVD